METFRIQKEKTLYEKLSILSDAAKYDVACTSSGIKRSGDGTGIGNCEQAGICHSFTPDGRCVSLLKILFTNECIFDCKYCINRASNDVERTSFTPDEICRLVIEFYRRNYIEGLFLSSGVWKSPDYTMRLIYETLLRLRREYRFQGYIHVKAIPGASPELIEKVGYLADRMSVNLELPTAEGLRVLAPQRVFIGWRRTRAERIFWLPCVMSRRREKRTARSSRSIAMLQDLSRRGRAPR